MGMPHDVAASPGKESAQTHECLAHRSITDNDTVKLTFSGVPFGVFLMVFRELQFGKSGFASELLRWFLAGAFGCAFERLMK